MRDRERERERETERDRERERERESEREVGRTGGVSSVTKYTNNNDNLVLYLATYKYDNNLNICVIIIIILCNIIASYISLITTIRLTHFISNQQATLTILVKIIGHHNININ